MKSIFRKTVSMAVSVMMVLSVFSFVSFADVPENKLEAPVVKSFAYTGKNYIKIDWNNIEDADGYKVYRKKGDGPWKRIAVIKGERNSEYRDKSVSGSYYYSVRAYRKSGNRVLDGYKSDEMKFRTLRTLSINVTGNDGDNTIRWKEVPYATGYRIYERIGKKGSWDRIATVGRVTKYTTSKTGHGCYHYYKVRPVYTSADGDISLGNYSNIDKFMWWHEPDYEVTMLYDYDDDATVVSMSVTNNSSNDYMKILAHGAMLVDYEYSGFDRLLQLMNVEFDYYGDVIDYYPVKSVSIDPGETKNIFFIVKGDSTWYDEDTIIAYEFIYDGMKYYGASNASTGTDWEAV